MTFLYAISISEMINFLIFPQNCIPPPHFFVYRYKRKFRGVGEQCLSEVISHRRDIGIGAEGLIRFRRNFSEIENSPQFAGRLLNFDPLPSTFPFSPPSFVITRRKFLPWVSCLPVDTAVHHLLITSDAAP